MCQNVVVKEGEVISGFKKIGEKIRYYREKRGLSQKMLAKRLKLTESYVSKLITGERYNQDFERYIIHILDVNYCCI